MSNSVGEVNDSDFNQLVLQSEVPVLVEFWAPWCSPCRALAPIIEDVAEHHAGSVHVFKVNVDDSPDVTKRYGIRGIPTMLLFQDGLEKERIVGLVKQQQISSLIDRFKTADLEVKT